MVPNIFYFHPYLGKISHLANIFQKGWNHQLARYVLQNSYSFSVLHLSLFLKSEAWGTRIQKHPPPGTPNYRFFFFLNAFPMFLKDFGIIIQLKQPFCLQVPGNSKLLPPLLPRFWTAYVPAASARTWRSSARTWNACAGRSFRCLGRKHGVVALFADIRGGLHPGRSGSTIRTLLHGKINLKKWQVASPLVMQGFSKF